MNGLEWHTEKRIINDLIPYEKNPRRLTEKQEKDLTNSLKRFNLVEVPAIDLDNIIIAGHMRLKILQQLNRGDEKIDVRVPNRKLTQQEFDEYNLRSNKNTGEFDIEMLINEFNIDLLHEVGFEDIELNIGQEININESDDDIPELKENEVISKLGDIWELGQHKIICGDSRDSLNIENLLQKQKILLIVTDPPYGVNYDPEWREGCDLGIGNRSKGKVANDDIIDWSSVFTLINADILYIWHAAKYAHEVAKGLIDNNYEIISQIIWAKQHFVLSRGDYHWKHEPCWYAVKKGKQHNWQGARDQSTLWEIKNNNSFGNYQKEETVGHGTQKPIECMLKPILNNSKENDIICDPFLGSGTTLIACEKSNRICYGCEIEPKYIDVIIRRWLKFMIENKKQIILKLNGKEFEHGKFLNND